MSDLIDDISALLGLPRANCEGIARTAPNRYKVFYIPKRNGRDLGLVAQPAREVKAIQRLIIQLIENKLPIHDAATAYRSGGSIFKNAKPHAAARFITKLDCENFFPCIDRTSLRRHLAKYLLELTPNEIDFILSACCWRPKGTSTQRLCIGAPTSPMLSNSIMYEVDRDISNMCAEVDVVYTRYSDDICISATRPDVLGELERKIRSRIAQNKFPSLTLNDKKRVSVGRGNAMNVTGLTLSNTGLVTVGRKRKRGVRSGAMHYINGILSADEIFRLKGEIAFVISVEPGYRYVLWNTYGAAIAPLLPRIQRAVGETT
jgi:hypothetical protein